MAVPHSRSSCRARSSARRRKGRRARASAFRCSKSFFQVLRLHLGILGHDLLHIVRKIGELLHLPNLDHFVVRGRAALRPFDRLLFRLHLDHPIAAQDLLRNSSRRSSIWLQPCSCPFRYRSATGASFLTTCACTVSFVLPP